MTDLKTMEARWDLNVLYAGIDDPQIDNDVALSIKLTEQFAAAYKGKLATTLGAAITALSEISMLQSKFSSFLQLKNSLNTADSAVKAKLADIDRRLSAAAGRYMAFFDIEVAALDEKVIDALAASDAVVAKHRPWIDHIRVFKPYMLTEEVEGALTKRSPFGAGAWSDFFDELEADLEFDFKGEMRNLPFMLNVIAESTDAAERADAMRLVNESLRGTFAKYSAETLYNIIGLGSVEDTERGYVHPMHSRNLSNRIPDAVADALHTAVIGAAPLAQRYYKLKAKLLGMETLRWSDRNAPLPFSDTSIIPFDEAQRIVIDAYASFSPTLAHLVRDTFAQKRIDAPAVKGKRGGAFNASYVLPGGKPIAWTLLNYLGANGDVMTLAHELGHGVHGLLAGEAQGVLQYHPPIAYCETASIFGELITFNFLKQRLLAKNDTQAVLALFMDKINDMLNTTVRQIGFSNFERRMHGMNATYTAWEQPKKLSVEELSALWMHTTHELYGAPGEVFTYDNIEYMWSYIGHFHRPFYVYGYAFGELLTQSIYAQRGALGADFEAHYLELLRSGSTKDAIELLKPFGLNPADPQFWLRGIELSIGAMIAEAEGIAAELKLI
ncbi:MAG: M3 family oligoendopeptidase [Parcubacteria group bacterium]|nr:M3 family oligoendopeptidase [Parcubacteria group bacterium]